MPAAENIKELLKGEKARALFARLYGPDEDVISDQIRRYTDAIERFETIFKAREADIQLFSTPGRTEIGGNHTDHNRGRVLAASVNLDSIAVAAVSGDGVITIYSEGYPNPFIVDVNDVDPKKEEEGTTTAIMRGIASRFKQLGYSIGGFNAYITSDVFKGSGLSSSASIEVLLGTILNHLYNEGKVDARVLAEIGQYAENVYFNKPCGLMDQMACAVGGFVTIDFKDPANPAVKKVNFDFSAQDYSLLVVDTGGNHADLTEDYASVPREMKAVARELGGEVCREFSMGDVIKNIPKLRPCVGDRAILRAMHFFADDERVVEEVEALEGGDFRRFLALVNESGSSSWRWLQNCFTTQNPAEQGISLALAVTEVFFKERKAKGACRVHGGGFAGTIQVFMPNEFLQDYIELMENIFGKKSVIVLSVRPYGTVNINSLI